MAGAADQDTVWLTNHQRINGVIDPSESHDDMVAIRTRPGSCAPKDLVSSQERSYATRRPTSPPTAPPRPIASKLPSGASNAKDRAHAANCCAAITKDGASAACFGLLAKLLDQKHDVDHAFPMYQDTQHGGADPGCSPVCSRWRNTPAVPAAARHQAGPWIPPPPLRHLAGDAFVGTAAVDDGLEARTGW